MPKIKVQQRKVKSRGKEYVQYWVALPKAIVESLRITPGNSLDVFVERSDIVLRRV